MWWSPATAPPAAAKQRTARRYICVTADAYSSWRAIYDHVALYKTYCSPADDTTEDGGAADPLVEPVAPTIKDTTEHESGASL